MPLYEEKLINPFSVRFAQEHIRTSFRDGRPVEAAIDEIASHPGSGDYDVILRAPFPHIEILRFGPPCLDCDEANREEATPDGHHWFTLDNRRLYCLQKAAAALLPKRAAVVVEILYADDGHIWRKFDTETQGLSVSIGHSSRTAPIARWAWRDEVAEVHREKVMKAMWGDDRKTDVDALHDASDGSAESIVDRLTDALSRLEAYEASMAKPSQSSCPTPSTTDDSSDEAASQSSSTPISSATRSSSRDHMDLVRLRGHLGDVKWADRRGDSYEVVISDGGPLTCVQHTTIRSKTVPLYYDREDGVVYWGTDMSFFFDAGDIEEGSDQVNWYAYADWEKKRPRFSWRRSEPTFPSSVATVPHDALASSAIMEIKGLLEDEEYDGRIRIPHWMSKYGNLGSLRSFLQSYPEHFTVQPAGGHQFTVFAASAGRPGDAASGCKSLSRSDVKQRRRAIARLQRV